MLRLSILLACVLGIGFGCGSGASPQEGVMKIRFERTGGFAGMTRTVEVDVDTLPDDERARIRQLVDNADFYALPTIVPRNDQGGADLYNYRLTIESADGTHTVEAAQLSMPESLEPLIDWLDRSVQMNPPNSGNEE